MAIPVSLVLITFGAILAFAVKQDPNPAVDIDVVGWVLMSVGFFGLLLSLLWWERIGPGAWGGRYPLPRRRTVIEEERARPPEPRP